MANPIRWIRDLISFVQFVRAGNKRDKSGKKSGFLYSSDDPRTPDYHHPGTVFDNRVFVGFERESLAIAQRFESALKGAGLEPWRYEPSEAESVIEREYSLELKEMRDKYGETAKRLAATVRRCPAAIIIVSDRSLRSPYCELEAWTTGIIHGFWSKERIRNEAGVFVVLERPNLSPPAFLSQFWSRVYEEGLEDALADLISQEIERLALMLRQIEAHRSATYR